MVRHFDCLLHILVLPLSATPAFAHPRAILRLRSVRVAHRPRLNVMYLRKLGALFSYLRELRADLRALRAKKIEWLKKIKDKG